MTAGEIDCLFEEDCMTILDFLVKKAYGQNARILHRHYFDMHEFDFLIHVDNCYFLLLMFDVHDDLLKEFHVSYLSYKDFLKNIVSIIDKYPDAYVAYLPYVNHVLDKNTSFEEVLVNLDLLRTYV